ncbi:MAG: succinate dehydrogenase, cytochrome b556 subunit [Gammaproteobacteria bacterium]|nr:succinate dehydrogenase, cytochrome b556 subunit [Gammaproteobacteria bacterium]
MLTKTRRPKHLNLLKIRLPLTGMVSIFHRLSGVILFFSIPFAIYLLALSLRSPETFLQAGTFFEHGLVKLLSVIVIYSLAHHFFAGLRFLLLDLDIGLSLKNARLSAWIVVILGFVAFAFLAIWLLAGECL